VGRLDDIGHDSNAILTEIVEVFSVNEFSTKVIAASIRHPLHVQAALLGCDIATIPPAVFRSGQAPVDRQGHSQFQKDWEEAQSQELRRQESIQVKSQGGNARKL
jgi:transaldolase